MERLASSLVARRYVLLSRNWCCCCYSGWLPCGSTANPGPRWPRPHERTKHTRNAAVERKDVNVHAYTRVAPFVPNRVGLLGCATARQRDRATANHENGPVYARGRGCGSACGVPPCMCWLSHWTHTTTTGTRILGLATAITGWGTNNARTRLGWDKVQTSQHG